MGRQSRALAAAQTCPVRGDVDANVRQHRALATLAAQAGARIIAFPELSLTGYELDLAEALAFSERDPRLDPLRDVARSHGVTLIVGAPVRLEQRLCIGAFVLTDEGGVGLYTKHHLGAFRPQDAPDGKIPPPEGRFFVTGDRNPALPLGDHLGAVSICADGIYPEHAAAAAALGADTYFSCQFAIPDHVGYKLHKLKKAALSHSLTVVFANFGADSGGLPSGGRSGVWSSRGECLVELGVSGAGVALAIEAADAAGWHTQAISL